ncbi:18593_t:CDS:2 [Funneliformis geosporum]|uniref:18593_t:CDS:1 n=1 Tax=Funneliformis geosporum TaxID=1117311 RepID=A0A9W4SQX8_9GLOM|nr:18593_t:CDS:2 [Funneliformis geosporum]
MRLGDFSLEVLIENKVLPEYEIPIDDDTKLISYSQESINKRMALKKESKNVTYVLVPESTCHFAIRVGVHSTKDPDLFKGIHIVDGKNDNTHMKIDPMDDETYTYMYGFYNHNKSVFHLFKFEPANWMDDNVYVSNIPRIAQSKITKNKGRLGAISVYIYKAEKIPEKRTSSKTNHNQERHTTCLEDLDFDPADIIFTPKQDEPFINLKTLHPHPVARLHVHYQTKQWFHNHYKSKGLPIPKTLLLSHNNLIEENIDEVNECRNEELIESEKQLSSSNSDTEQEEKDFLSSDDYIIKQEKLDSLSIDNDNKKEKEDITSLTLLSNNNNYKEKMKKIIIPNNNHNDLNNIDNILILNDDNVKDYNSEKIVIHDNGFKDMIISDNLNNTTYNHSNIENSVDDQNLYNQNSNVNNIENETDHNKFFTVNNNIDDNNKTNNEKLDKQANINGNDSRNEINNTDFNMETQIDEKIDEFESNRENINESIYRENKNLDEEVEEIFIAENISTEENIINLKRC